MPRADDPSVEKALGHLTSLLVPGETLEAYAVQHRLFSLTHRRILVGATSGRLIAMERGLFGGYDPRDVRWQDLKEVRLRVGIIGADLRIVSFSSPDLATAGQTSEQTFEGLRKDQAQDVYRICQANEQAWREKRRIRELEELRAKSGGIHLGASPTGVPPSTVAEKEDPVARLERAREMLEKGLISDAEYESLKARIVNTL